MSALMTTCVVLGVMWLRLAHSQVPPRLNIPGALLLQQGGPRPLRPHRDGPVPLRFRKPGPNALPIAIPIREEIEDADIKASSILDEEVAKFSLPASLQPKIGAGPDNDIDLAPPRPVQFRPERPVQLIRQQQQQDFDDEPLARPVLLRQQQSPPKRSQQQKARPAPQVYQPRPAPSVGDDPDDRRYRNRKPPVQILRKYRTDNDDGSITWGFENEDGTFKEETIGTDCIIRGKYGYIDPEGTRREYSYEAGNKCDPQEEELPEEESPRELVTGKLPKKQYLSRAS